MTIEIQILALIFVSIFENKTMAFTWLIGFLLLGLSMVPSNAYYASSMIKISGKSADVAASLRQAAQILNVPEPGRI